MRTTKQAEILLILILISWAFAFINTKYVPIQEAVA
jgi:hypothetical protein